jgi:hypothetical protein
VDDSQAEEQGQQPQDDQADEDQKVSELVGRVSMSSVMVGPFTLPGASGVPAATGGAWTWACGHSEV